MRGTEPSRPFGRLLTAMVTPFGVAGEVDHAAAADLARYLVDEQGNDGIVVNGTTGEAPTTTDGEKAELIATVVEAVGDRATVVAGVGTFDTVHSVHLAEQAAAAGADGLLVVTPYYSKPPQAGIAAHFATVADAGGLPTMLYDIPHRTGTAIAAATFAQAAQHPLIVGVKDAKLDLEFSAQVIADTGLAFYCGSDAMTLPLLSVGGVGLVGTSTHVSGAGMKALIEAYERADTAEALRLHRQLLPILTGIFRAQGVVLVKAALALLGRPVGSVRPPLLEADAHEISHLRMDLEAAGLL